MLLLGSNRYNCVNLNIISSTQLKTSHKNLGCWNFNTIILYYPFITQNELFFLLYTLSKILFPKNLRKIRTFIFVIQLILTICNHLSHKILMHLFLFELYPTQLKFNLRSKKSHFINCHKCFVTTHTKCRCIWKLITFSRYTGKRKSQIKTRRSFASSKFAINFTERYKKNNKNGETNLHINAKYYKAKLSNDRIKPSINKQKRAQFYIQNKKKNKQKQEREFFVVLCEQTKRKTAILREQWTRQNLYSHIDTYYARAEGKKRANIIFS